MQSPSVAPSGVHSPARFQLSRVVQVSGAHAVNDLLTLGIVPALLPFFKIAFNLNYEDTGWIMFACLVTTSVLQPFFGVLTDKHPSSWLLPLSVVVTGVGLVATAYAPSFGWLLVAVAVSGLGSGAFHPEAARCAYLAAGPSRTTSQAIFQFGGFFGQSLGPLMIPLFIRRTGLSGLDWFLLPTVVAAILCLALVPWYRAHAAVEKGRSAVRTGTNHPGIVSLLLAVTTLRSFSSVSVVAFLPFFYLNVIHLSIESAMLFTFCFMCAGSVGTLLGGILSDRLGYKRLIVGSLLIAPILLWALPRVSGWHCAVVLFTLGFVVYAPFGASVVFAQLLLPRNIGLASGLSIGFAIGAGGLATTLLGKVADAHGVETIFRFLFLVPLAGGLLALALPNERKMRLASQQAIVPA